MTVKSRNVRGVLNLDQKIKVLEAKIAKRQAPFDERIKAIEAKRNAVVAKAVARLVWLKADRVLKLGKLNGTQVGELARVRREEGGQ